MNAVELYETWAPTESPWSCWAKPVLFARLGTVYPTAGMLGLLQARADSMAADWAGSPSPPRRAVILDVPGVEATAIAVALANVGWRPVPLFNGCLGHSPAVEVIPIIGSLLAGAGMLQRLQIPAEAPPVFMLDSARMGSGKKPEPGVFDNRWVVFPQDFPSANHLKSFGITEALVVQDAARGARIPDDLSHVLMRWQEEGIRVMLSTFSEGQVDAPRSVEIPRPSLFRSMLYRLVTMFSLRPSYVGGFGSVVPQQSHGHGVG